MAGLLGGLLGDLDVPSTAKLVAIETHFDDDGSQTWTVTFRSSGGGDGPLPPRPSPTPPPTNASFAPVPAPPPTAAAVAPPTTSALAAHDRWSKEESASSSAAAAASVPPKPPPLTDVQLGGSLAADQLLPRSLVPIAGPSAPSEPSVVTSIGAPPPSSPSAFPLLPFQVGAVNRLFPLRACLVPPNPTARPSAHATRHSRRVPARNASQAVRS